MRVLILDIETSPILAYVWKTFDETVGTNQIAKDWQILSFSAKWLNKPKIHYYDTRHDKDDEKLLDYLWELLDEADVVIAHNGKKFDIPKINARMKTHGIKPPSSYRQIDTYREAKKIFGFTSNSLEYLTSKLCKTHKKTKSRRFQGFELWKECLNGNMDAWREMEKYNKLDVLSLEELYLEIRSWSNSINFHAYGSLNGKCECGGNLQRNGYGYTNRKAYQRVRCYSCGKEYKQADVDSQKSKCKT
jgi:uncharacterized protein YprB with RNaseH-like and TPR domain